MNDDSAEWMAMFKASGQLRPVPHEGMEVTEDERQRVEAHAHVGLVSTSNDEGRQVLGTCWPERWLTFKAAIRVFLNLHHPQLSDDERQSVDEQTRVRTEIIRKMRVEP